VYIDKASLAMSQNYYAAFVHLAYAVNADRGAQECEEIIAAMTTALPPQRLQPPDQMADAISSACSTQ
jgi:hypothetical protein